MNSEQQAARTAELERLEREILSGLAGLTPESPVWKSLNAAIKFYFDAKTDELLAPNLTSEQRHYLSGFAAGLLEVQHFLEVKRGEAQVLRKK